MRGGEDLGLALAVLRVIRGWSQADLARSAGVRNSSVSNYERGKKAPELKTLQRLVGSMGFSLAALDHAQMFINALRSDSLLSDFAGLRRPEIAGEEVAAPPQEPSRGETEFLASQALQNPGALQWEMEIVSAEAGRLVSRFARLLFTLMGGPQPNEPSPAHQQAEERR